MRCSFLPQHLCKKVLCPLQRTHPIMRHPRHQLKPHLHPGLLKRPPQAHQPLRSRLARIIRTGHPIPLAAVVGNLPRLQIRFAHHHLHRHACHGFHIERDAAKLAAEVSCADPPVPSRVEEGDGTGSADGDGPESVWVEEEEAVGEVAAS